MAKANLLCDHAPMARDYMPPEDVARTVTRLERNADTGKKLKQELHDLAVREMKEGATVGQLAKHLPWSAETLRGIARKAGIPLKREPTVVGKKAMQDAVAEALAAQAPPSAPPTPAGRQPQSAPRSAVEQPPQHLGISPEVMALSDEQVRSLVADVEANRLDWASEVRRELRGGDTRWAKRYIVQAAANNGHIDLPDLPDPPA